MRNDRNNPRARSLPGPDDIVQHDFDNGIVALVRENHTSPAVVVAGYLKVGAIDVPAEQAGLSSFAASALMRGTHKRSFSQIYEEIEAVGAQVSFGSGGHTTSFSAKSLSEDLPLVLEILAQAIQQPTFPETEIERLRGQILTALAMRANDTGSVASLTFRKLAYSFEHPYGRSVRGYADTIQALTRQDLMGFFERGYGAAGMTLCIVGAVRAQDALHQVEATFGGWQGQSFSRPPLPPTSQPEGIIREYVELENKSQADIVMGLPGPARAEPDYLDAALANHILGVFGMMGRLGKRLRDQQGLAYSIYSRLEGGLGPGPWTIVAGVDPDNIERTIEQSRAEVRRMQESLVDATELEDVQTYLTGSLPLSLETNEGVAGAILNMVQYELGLDYLSRYPDLIGAVTPQRIQAAARKWFDTEHLAIGSAGPPLKANGAQL
jgi:zinc protease